MFICSFTPEALAEVNRLDKQDVKNSEEKKSEVLNPLTKGFQPLQYMLAMNAKDAVIQGQLRKFRLLWSLMNKSGPWAYRLLFTTIRDAQDPQFLETLLKSNTLDLNTRFLFPFLDSHTALSAAIESKNITPKSIQALLNGGADPNIPNPNGKLPLHIAIEMQSLERVQILLDNGADPNIPNGKGQSALHVSLDLKPWYTDRSITVSEKFSITLSIIEALLEAKANPNTPNPDGQLPLHMIFDLKSDQIATKSVPIIIQELLDAGADPNATTNDEKKETLLQRAISRHHQVAFMLLEHPETDIHATNASGETALYTAVSAPNPKIVQALLARGAKSRFKLIDKFIKRISSDPRWRSGEAWQETLSILLNEHRMGTILLAMLLHRSIGAAPWVTEMLMQTKGMDVQATDDMGLTVLHRAAVSTKLVDGVYILNTLLKDPKIRALINEPNKAGDTPLHEAIASLKNRGISAYNTIHELLNAGADPNATDGKGRTPLDLLLSVRKSVGNEQDQRVYSFGNSSYKEEIAFFQRFRNSAIALIQNDAEVSENIRVPVTELLLGRDVTDFLLDQKKLESVITSCYD